MDYNDKRFISIYLETAKGAPYRYFKDPLDKRPKMSDEMESEFYSDVKSTLNNRKRYNCFTKKDDIQYHISDEIFKRILDLENTYPHNQWESPLTIRTNSAYNYYKGRMHCRAREEFMKEFEKIVEGCKKKDAEDE